MKRHRAGRSAAHLWSTEGDHLPPEDVEFDDEPLELAEQASGPLFLRSNDLEGYSPLGAVLARAPHEHDELRPAVVHEEQPELHTKTAIVRADGQIDEIRRADADPRSIRCENEVGQRLEVPRLTRETD